MRLVDYLEHIEKACVDCIADLKGITRETFLLDSQIQRSVTMSIIIIGEASTKISQQFPVFVQDNPQIPWIAMRGIRNRLVHGYYEINLNTLWNTATTNIPEVYSLLSVLKLRAESYTQNIQNQ